MEISTIGLDLAKSVFQIHGINDAGEIVVRKTIRRSQVLPFIFGRRHAHGTITNPGPARTLALQTQ